MANLAGRGRSQSVGYILHSYPYKETSLIVEAFTQTYGRISCVAKGAKRPASGLRSSIQLFQPLEMEWSGRNELKTLYRVDWVGGVPILDGLALICGFYINELILNLLAKDDPHENLFKCYYNAINDLNSETAISIVLRKFEINLLREIGYQLKLDYSEEENVQIEPKGIYTYLPETGPMELKGSSQHKLKIHGKTFCDIQNANFSDPRTLLESKKLMRYLLEYYLGDKILHSRELLKNYKQI
ncbi:MAG: DNA repair protein RecO [Proteobacteria bacterium]|nr:DNA repair protein RecO [Pseudomonadota bacterium]